MGKSVGVRKYLAQSRTYCWWVFIHPCIHLPNKYQLHTYYAPGLRQAPVMQNGLWTLSKCAWSVSLSIIVVAAPGFLPPRLDVCGPSMWP